jgi:peptidyl-dipeptidase Dcp
MARTPERVRDLLMAVWAPARARAEADAAVLERMMQQDGVNGPLEAWDWRYYAEKRRAVEHDLDDASAQAIPALDRMIEAVSPARTGSSGWNSAPSTCRSITPIAAPGR